jgi:hypothetical protein
MNHSIFRRLLWKEYRLQRSFWIAMAVLGLMVMLLVWAFCDRLDERVFGLFYTLLVVPVFYLLGCASTTFAGEHDADTYQFQRSLPVTAMQVFWSKIAFAILSTFAMAVLLWVLDGSLAHWQFPGWVKYRVAGSRTWDADIQNSVISALVFAWLYMLWGVFFSLILKRPLLSAIVTVTVASLGMFLVGEQLDVSFPSADRLPTVLFVSSTVLLAVVDVWLGRRWFCETASPILHIKRWARLKKSSKPETLTEYLSHANSWSMFWRLSWQHWRQSAWILIVILVMLAPALVFVCTALWMQKPPRNDWLAFVMSIGMLSALAMPPLVGSFTFLTDQRLRSFHFFAERGIHPRLVWLSRLWPWLIFTCFALVVFAIIFSVMFFLLPSDEWRSIQRDIIQVQLCLSGYIVLSICVGQFCSMFFRSSLLASVFSLIITGLLCAWAAFMWCFGVSWIWSVAPIPVVLLLATWMRAPDWLLERGGLRGWWRAGLTLVVPVVIILTAVPLFRIFEIPVVDPGFEIHSFLRPLTPEEQATLDIYIKAIQKYSPPPSPKPSTEENNEAPVNADLPHLKFSHEEIEWVKANQDIIPLVVEASKGQINIFTPSSLVEGPSNPMRCAWSVSQLGGLLFMNAIMQESDGKLDAAIEQYLAALRISKQLHSSGRVCDSTNQELHIYYQLPLWAARSGQTSERIKKAIVELEKITADMPAGAAKVKFDYLQARQQLLEGFEGFPKGAVPALTAFWLYLPWERARALRLLNVITRDDLRSMENTERWAVLGNKLQVAPKSYHSPRPSFSNEAEYVLRKAVWVSPLRHFPQGVNIVSAFANLENHRRATLIILALQAWKLEHGTYPKTLDELVGPYLERLPNDPYSGEPYQYYPEGVKVPLPSRGINFELFSTAKDKPVIWSTSPNLREASPSENEFYQRYQIFEVDPGMSSEQGHFRSADIFDIYMSGNFFLVP